MVTPKNRWRVRTDGADPIVVSYRVYAREMSVRTNWVDDALAMLNGAATFLTLVEPGPRAHEVTLELPLGWKKTMTGLREAPGGTPHHYLAPDFDTLVDSPIVAGNPAAYEFEVAGRQHYLVNTPNSAVFDGARAVKDVEKIVRVYYRLWRALPYDKYVFLNMITESGGGLEHRNSALLMTSRWSTRNPRRYLGWLGLVSHEYFHLWNVKRLRPVELGPFDYERENYTKSLWIAEGITEYYGDLALRRAGLATEPEYLEGLSNTIRALQTTPGRRVQSAEMASFDTWIKHYRPDENTPNTAISYYAKGEVIAFLLDAKIRKATGGVKSLDDVMRLAYERYAGDRGYRPQQFRAVAEEVAAADLASWFERALESTEELDYSEALQWFGVRFRAPPTSPEAEQGGWLGLITRVDDGRLVVSEVRRGTPGYEAGFNVGDEIVAIDDLRVLPTQWAARLEGYRPGDRVSVLVARREELRRIDVALEQEPPNRWRLEVNPDATAAQREQRRNWLTP